MGALSNVITKVNELKSPYKEDCFNLRQLISSIKSCSAGIAFNNFPNNRTHTRSWNNDNFYLFDEVKGINLLLIRLLEEYQNLRIKLDTDIEDCMQ